MAIIQCPECGAMVSDQAAQCPKCGAPIAGNAQLSHRPAYQQVPPGQQAAQPSNPKDTSSILLNILSFLFPVLGWILYFAMKGNSPVRAKACSKYAWIGLAFDIVAYIIFPGIFD